MACKSRRLPVIGDVELRAFVDVLLAVGPLDLDAFLLEQPLVVGDQFRQSLEGGGRFQNQILEHASAPRVRRRRRRAGASSRTQVGPARSCILLYSIVDMAP